jgi:hypothetical protein
MAETITLSTEIDSQIKKAALEFCRRRGLKLRYLVEQALMEQLEDEIDLEAYHQRRSEETVSLEDILSGPKKKTRK